MTTRDDYAFGHRLLHLDTAFAAADRDAVAGSLQA
jgi:arginine deiminase